MHYYKAIFELAATGIARVSPHGQWLEVNQRLAQILGYEHDELLRKSFQEVTHPEDLGLDLSLVDETLRGARNSYTMAKRYITKTGGLTWANLSVSLVRDVQGRPDFFISVIEDINALKEAESKLERLARYDALTGLPNRLYLEDQLRSALAHARSTGGRVGLAFLDLNGFKAVNDAYGHQVGDALLVATADRLRGAARRSDFVARLGGDEFVFLIKAIGTQNCDLPGVATRLRAAFNAPFRIGGRIIGIGPSIGLACAPDDGFDAESLLQVADRMMYLEKRCATRARG